VTLPVFTPCPEGWREVPVTESGDVIGCDPFPEGGYQECGVDEGHFIGEPGCLRVGTPCPEGNWAEDLPTDREILYVLSGAPPGGDGTRESPFGTISEAMRQASVGTVIALSKGTFDEWVMLRSGVTLWGACVLETIVTCSEVSDGAGTISVTGWDAGVRNLRISGNRPGIWVYGMVSINIEDVIVDSAEVVGLLAANRAHLTGRSIIVRNTRSRGGDGMFGRGLNVEEGAQVDVNRAIFERNREVGVLVAHSGTVLNLTDVIVRDTQSQESDRMSGRGLQVQEGAQVEVNRAIFERNREVGVLVAHSGTVLNLTDVIVRDTQSRESDRVGGWGLGVGDGAQVDVNRAIFERDREVSVVAMSSGTVLNLTDIIARDTQSQESDKMSGVGLQASEGAQVDVNRAVFERNRDLVVAAFHEGTVLNLTNVIVRDTQSQESDRMSGVGLQASEGAQVEINRAIFERNRDVGVLVAHSGTVLNLNDVIVRDTQSRESDRISGSGLGVQEGAQVEVNRAIFERNRDVGVIAAHSGTVLNLNDVIVRDTQSQESDRMGGKGLGVGEGAQVEVNRAVLEKNRDVAFVAFHEGTVLNLTDVIVRDTRSQESDRKFGRGLQISDGAQVEVSRAIFERNREFAVTVYNEGTVLNLIDVVIRDTLERECALDTCAGFGAGTGVASFGGANIEMTNFIITNSALCGLQLAHGGDPLGIPYPQGGTADLHNGIISNNLIGVNIQTEDFDIYRLMDNVIYINNQRNLDTTYLPIPDISTELPPSD